MTLRIHVSADLRRRMEHRSAIGTGGFQSLTKRLLGAMDDDGWLDISSEWKQEIEHYAFDFGSGGWQTLLRELLALIDQAESHA